MTLKIAVAMRATDVIDLRGGRDDAAQFAVLAKRPTPQGGRTRDLAPVACAVVGAIEI